MILSPIKRRVSSTALADKTAHRDSRVRALQITRSNTYLHTRSCTTTHRVSAVGINVSDVDLDRTVILGLDQPVRRGAEGHSSIRHLH